ncbi:MAG: class I SAM-dependent methyltransferase [Lautropia sp.]
MYFHGGGSGYADYTAEADLLLAHGRRYRELVAQYASPGALLDIGCAAGYVAKAFADAGWHASGIDPNVEMVAVARDQMRIGAVQGSLEQADSSIGLEVPDGGFDLVTLIQVVAHLYDLPVALRRLASLTRIGGLCLIETWDSASLTARLLGRRWHEYSPPSALHYFSRGSLDRALAAHGFDRVATGRPLKRLRLDHARSLFRHTYANSVWGRAAAAALDYLPGAFTIPYPAEDLFWTLYRRMR